MSDVIDRLPHEWREYLLVYGVQIGQQARDGRQAAARVISAYSAAQSGADDDVAALLGALRVHDIDMHGLTTVCAWCGEVMDEGSPRCISHGMCDECAERYEEG